MILVRSLLVLPACLVVLVACGRSGGPPSEPDPRFASAEEIGFGCGGGFTGAWDGRTPKRDGTVEVWSSGDETRPLPPAVAVVVGRLRALRETP